MIDALLFTNRTNRNQYRVTCGKRVGSLTSSIVIEYSQYRYPVGKIVGSCIEVSIGVISKIFTNKKSVGSLLEVSIVIGYDL